MRLVRIIDCQNQDYWYKNKIGEVYGVGQDVISDLHRVIYGIDNNLGQFYLSEVDIIDISEERDGKLKELGI